MTQHSTVEKHKVNEGIQLSGRIRVNRSPETCYRVWRDFKKLPQFLKHIYDVIEVDDRRSHWIVTGPADTTVEWDAEVVEDIPGTLIRWRSTEGSQVKNSGHVLFKGSVSAPLTDVMVSITYDPPFGAIGEWFTELFGGNPDQILEQNLYLFKKAVETGETSPEHLTT